MATEYWDTYSGEPLSDYDLEQRYDEMLDECFPTVEFGGVSYDPSTVLYRVDPIAYRCGFSEWLDSEISDGNISETDPSNEIGE
ncbi:phage hypothetical protein [Stenotrophomonas virus Jojan60]|nr:phage hypothetical protein [Stenotrophomonas virus Jojan60]